MFFARLAGGFVLRTLANASEAFEGDMMLGVVFMAIGQATVSHIAPAPTPGSRRLQAVTPRFKWRWAISFQLSADRR